MGGCGETVERENAKAGPYVIKGVRLNVCERT